MGAAVDGAALDGVVVVRRILGKRLGEYVGLDADGTAVAEYKGSVEGTFVTVGL